MTPHDILSEPPAARSSRAAPAWVEWLARRAIRHAAYKAPAALSDRLEEEWLADLAMRQGALARVRLALGCCWATRVIAHDLGTSFEAAAAATADKAAAVCTPSAPASFSRRTAISVLILSLHTLVIYGLASGMAKRILEEAPPRLQVTLTPAAAPNREPPPLNVKVKPLRFSLSPPERIPDIDLTRVTVAAADLEAPQSGSASASMSRAVQRIAGGPGPGFPNSADYYPDAARRLGEKGVAMVHVCIDGTGRLTAEPTIAQSSGSARLDEGALRLARAGSGHYRAATEDGSPVSSCYAFGVRFELRD
jgi:protein TonB